MKRAWAYAGAAAFLAMFWTLPQAGASGLAPGTRAPELRGGPWLGGGNNNAPLQLAELRGKVVLLDMWTFG